MSLSVSRQMLRNSIAPYYLYKDVDLCVASLPSQGSPGYGNLDIIYLKLK